MSSLWQLPRPPPTIVVGARNGSWPKQTEVVIAEHRGCSVANVRRGADLRGAPPAALNSDTQTFATDVSDDPIWTIQGRLAGKDTPVSGIAEVPEEQRGYYLDPFDQLIDPTIYPVNDRGVLVAYTADGVRSVLVEWLAENGAVLQSSHSGSHLAAMVSAGYPPLIASTVPNEARTLRLTPESEDQQAMSAPIILTDLTAINPPG